jgi:membrane fusion protein (multidrug efflux system)
VRYVVAILFALLLLAGLGAVKAAQIGTLVSAGKAAKAAGPPPEVVGTAIARDDIWQETVSDIGTVTSARAVTVSNDAPGLVTRILFDSGKEVKRGDLLVELDTKVERAQLAASEAREALAKTTFGRSRRLENTGAIPRSELDTDFTGFESSRKDSDSVRAQITHKQIRAPFDGKLGIRQVNLGQYLASGTAVTVLQTAQQLYVDFNLPQERLPDLSRGMRVRITETRAADAGAPREGTIEAIEPAVDPATRMVRIRATAPNDDGALRSGMFIRATVLLPREKPVVLVPATAIVHASFGDSVYVVEDKAPDSPGMRTTPEGRPVKTARQQFVRTGEERGDFVAIEEGLKAKQEVVVAGGFKLRNGVPVVVDNTIQPKPELAPHPQNR